ARIRNWYTQTISAYCGCVCLLLTRSARNDKRKNVMTRRKGADRRQEARNDNRYFRRVHRQQLQQRGAEQGGHHPIGLRAWRVCERDSGRNDCPSLWGHRLADGVINTAGGPQAKPIRVKLVCQKRPPGWPILAAQLAPMERPVRMGV